MNKKNLLMIRSFFSLQSCSFILMNLMSAQFWYHRDKSDACHSKGLRNTTMNRQRPFQLTWPWTSHLGAKWEVQGFANIVPRFQTSSVLSPVFFSFSPLSPKFPWINFSRVSTEEFLYSFYHSNGRGNKPTRAPLLGSAKSVFYVSQFL